MLAVASLRERGMPRQNGKERSGTLRRRKRRRIAIVGPDGNQFAVAATEHDTSGTAALSALIGQLDRHLSRTGPIRTDSILVLVFDQPFALFR